MLFIRKTINFLIESNIWIACCAIALSCQTYILFNIPIQIDSLLPLIFCATLIAYLIPRILAVRNMPPKLAVLKQRLSKQQKIFSILLILSIVSCAILFFFQKTNVQIALIFSGIITLLYSLPLVKWKGKTLKLREIGRLKIFWITLIWCVSTVILPMLNSNAHQYVAFPFLLGICLERCLFIFAITLPFDIRDMDFDRSRALDTIPLRIGASSTIFLAYACLILACIIDFLQYISYSNPSRSNIFLALLISYLLIAYCIHQAQQGRKRQFYTGILDGTMLLQALLVFLFWV